MFVVRRLGVAVLALTLLLTGQAGPFTLGIYSATANSINAANLHLYVAGPSTNPVSAPQSLLEQVGSLLGLLPSTAEAKEFKGTTMRMTHSPDGASLLVSGYHRVPNAQGFFTPPPLSLRRIDVATGQIAAETSSPVAASYLQYAPDGSAIYTHGPESWNDVSS
jgi:hypothetical protein